MFAIASPHVEILGLVPPADGAGIDGRTTLTWMHVGGDLFSWLALLAIPLILLYFFRRHELSRPWLAILFAAFILATAFEHFIDALTFHFPLFRLAGFWKVLTAVLSWATVLMLISVIPRIRPPAAAPRLGDDDTTFHPIAGLAGQARTKDYIVAILAGVLALLLRAAVDPLVANDHVYVLSLLAVVFVSWQRGFWPGIVTLTISMLGMIYFFISSGNSFVVERFSDQLATGMFFFCGVCCAGLGEAQRVARRRTKLALAIALERKAELEAEVARRRGVEEDLRHSEATLRAFYDSAPVYMGIVEPLEDDVIHVYDNAASCRFFGVEPGATPGRRETELGMPLSELSLWVSKYHESGAKRQPVRFEYEYDSTRLSRWLSVTVSPIGKDSRGRKLFCYVAEDVTTRRQAENAIRESEARFRSMADNAPGIIWLSDANKKRTYFNKTWLEFTGRLIEQDVGDGWIDSIHPDDRDLYLKAYSEAHATRRPYELEYRLRRHDGAYRWVLARGTPRRSPSGAFGGFVGFCLDVTDRRKAQEAVRQSEERYRMLTEAIPQIVWNATANGEITYFNQRWLDYTELPLERARGGGWLEAIHPGDRDSVSEAWRSTIEGCANQHSRQFTQEFRLRKGDTDEYRWFLSVAVPLPSSDGTIDQWIGSMADIHDQKTASAVIAESEEKFRTMAESIPQLAWMTDSDGYVFWYNQRWYDFTGTTFDEMKGWGWQSALDPADSARVLEKFKSHIASGLPWEDTFTLRRHDGIMRWYLSRARPIRDKVGRIVRWFGTNTDITEYRQLEQALRDSAERFRTLTEAIPQIVWTADPNGEVTFVNRRWNEYTGLGKERAKLEGWGEVVHPQDVEQLRAEWQLAVTNQPERFTDEFRLRRSSDGEYRWMLSTAIPLRDGNGTLNEWVGSITDIDDQKRQAETLERMVRSRTTALIDEIEERKRAEQQVRAVAAELERSNGELEQFAYIASHDLQEPLRKIQAFGDRLLNRHRSELPESGQEYVDRMLSSAGRMRNLIDDLLTFSRVTTQAREFRRVDLTQVADEVLIDLDERIAQTGAKVEVGNLPTVDADPTQMRQLFQNLIANGVKFHRPGVQPVVEVRGELLTEPLFDSLGQAVPVCRITVRDNGIGFDEKYANRIFHVFQRLHGRSEFEGTGVGLAICRKIAERHGGTITAHSQSGEGATFVVTLPLRHSHKENGTDGQPDNETGHDTGGR